RESRVSGLALFQRLRRLRPAQLLADRREALQRLREPLVEHAHRRLHDLRQRLADLESRLRLLSPDQVLGRGYSITLDAASGKIIRSAADVAVDQVLRTRLKRGEIRSRVAF
ncbi:MAG: exodeoxyribonuclease VII large subunit, partial [Verrucomicrobia bacterium]|nr:exodeoxyribonuclease VII large subunit [Verrucomicrobiota bacterium]